MEQPQLTLEHVKFFPEDLDDRTLYVSLPYRTASHKCPCGCGNMVVTPLGPSGWQLTLDDGGATLHPSIFSRALDCQSHYWIRGNRVVWA